MSNFVYIFKQIGVKRDVVDFKILTLNWNFTFATKQKQIRLMPRYSNK